MTNQSHEIPNFRGTKAPFLRVAEIRMKFRLKFASLYTAEVITEWCVCENCDYSEKQNISD